jgi:hypothetical protein
VSRLPAEHLAAAENKMEWGEQWVARVRECFEQVGRTLKEYCKKYDVAEGDFPFLPDARRRHQEDGSLEVRQDDVYLLTLDIIKGTKSMQTPIMKGEIRTVFESFKPQGLIFEDTGNDCFVACCNDPRVLWDAACSIRLRGNALLSEEQPFRGTRKGLHFGSVNVIEKPSGEKLIQDIAGHSSIAVAVSLLDGIEPHVDGAKVNACLIIEGLDTAKRCAERLGIDLKAERLVQVQGKHYRGSGYIIDLP